MKWLKKLIIAFVVLDVISFLAFSFLGVDNNPLPFFIFIEAIVVLIPLMVKAIKKTPSAISSTAKSIYEDEQKAKAKRKLKKQKKAAMKEEIRNLELQKINEINERKAEAEKQGVPYCPFCGSTNITFQSSQYVEPGKKRTGLGLATAMVDPVAGIIVGNSEKDGKVKVSTYRLCMECGKTWDPSILEKQRKKEEIKKIKEKYK